MSVNNTENTSVFGEVLNRSLGELINLYPDGWRFLVEMAGGQTWLLIMSILVVMTFAIDFIFRTTIQVVNRLLKKRNQAFLKPSPCLVLHRFRFIFGCLAG